MQKYPFIPFKRALLNPSARGGLAGKALTSNVYSRVPSGGKTSAAVALILLLGLVSLLADTVYEGGRSVSGPLLEALSAPAIAAGTVAAGEALAYAARPLGGLLASMLGPRGPWAVTFLGYAITATAIPLLALAPTWREATLLYLAERLGKGLRAPARDSIIAGARGSLGAGKAFAIHEALDQVGAVAGPLIVAWLLTALGWRGLLALAVPGALSLAALLAAYFYASMRGLEPVSRGKRPDLRGVALLGFAGAALLAPWPVLSYHYAQVGAEAVAVFYAVAMAVDAGAAIASGLLVDRLGLKGLAPYPLLAAAATAMLALPPTREALLLAALLWGMAMGFLEAGFKAGVALLEGGSPRAYGVFGLSVGLGSGAAGLALSRAMGEPLLVASYIALTALLLAYSLMRSRHS